MNLNQQKIDNFYLKNQKKLRQSISNQSITKLNS
jgi:hypothetical protein